LRTRISLKRAAALTLVPIAAGLVLATVLRQHSRPAATPAPVLLAHAEASEAVDPRAGIDSALRARKGHALPRFGLSSDGVTVRAAAGDPTFGQPTISGIQGNGFEQDIRYDAPRNIIYTSVPNSLSSDNSYVWISRDGGRTFKWITASQPKVGKSVPCAGGGDSELALDGQGRLYFADLTLANLSVGRSDDQGLSFPCSNSGVPWTGLDRQWYAVDGDPVSGGGTIYLATNEVGQDVPPGECPGPILSNQMIIARSPIPPSGPASAGLQFAPPNRVSPHCNELILGNNEVSPVPTTTGEVGLPALSQPVRHVYIVHPNAAVNAILVARCFPVAFGPPVPNMSDPSGIRCNDLTVADFGNPAVRQTGANFPSLAVDAAGNLYAVWQQAQVVGGKPGDTGLKYSYSTNEGATWSAPITIPTPGLNNNVFTFAAAGDDGRLDISWIGTPATVNLASAACTNGGPDTVVGPWGAYFTQTLNAHDPTPTFSTPVLASEHPIHKLTVQTVLGRQCGNASRLLGDFFQMRIGPQGEANLVYATSAQSFSTHAMFVRQNGGTGVYANQTVSGDPILINSATDPSGDGTYNLSGMNDANKPNLDVLASSFTTPLPASCHPAGTACYRIQMTLNNLSLTPPAQDPVIDWLTQWFVPSDPACTPNPATACVRGGRNAFVYAESVNGAAISCYYGESYVQRVGGGLTRTYPGFNQISTPGACAAAMGVNGTITIEVPISAVSLPAGVAPFSATRYSVTASTLTLPRAANSVPVENVPQLGTVAGVPPDLVDVVRAYNAVDQTTSVVVTSLAARRSSSGVVVSWRTGSEVSLAGFNVWRLDPNGKARRLNRALIPARKSGKAAGASYRLVDRTAKRGAHAYRLQIVELNGAARFYARNVSVER
jgi:hypothetical protein